MSVVLTPEEIRQSYAEDGCHAVTKLESVYTLCGLDSTKAEWAKPEQPITCPLCIAVERLICQKECGEICKHGKH